MFLAPRRGGVFPETLEHVAIQPAALDDLVDRREAHLVELGRRRFDHVDFVGSEAIARRFVPVAAVEAVEVETDRFELRLPVPPRRDPLAFHQPPELCDEAEEPKPPRLALPPLRDTVVCVLATALLPGRGARLAPRLPMPEPRPYISGP
jgi:hypothetical protein